MPAVRGFCVSRLDAHRGRTSVSLRTVYSGVADRANAIFTSLVDSKGNPLVVYAEGRMRGRCTPKQAREPHTVWALTRGDDRGEDVYDARNCTMLFPELHGNGALRFMLSVGAL